MDGINLKDKFCLNIKEAAVYFGIGERRLRDILSSNREADFILWNGNKILIKRELFEQFLIDSYSL